MRGGLRNRYLRALGFTPLMLRDSGPEAGGLAPIAGRAEQAAGNSAMAGLGPQAESAQTPAPVDAVADSPSPPSSEPGATVQTLQDSLDPLATVLVAWADGDLELDPLHPGGGLLINMLAALKVPLGGFRILAIGEDSRADDWADRCIGNRPVFCLADQRPEWQAHELVMLPSLQRMLREQAPAKREAWSALQPWVGRLGTGDRR